MFSSDLVEYSVNVVGCSKLCKTFRKLKDARRYKRELKQRMLIKAHITRREFDGGDIPFILSERVVW